MSVIVSILFYEMYLTTTEIFLPSTVVDDSTFGRSFKPDAKINSIKESFALRNVNSMGYLGPSYPFAKESNTYRIVLIGDSFVEGIQVAEKHHFRYIIEDHLRAKLKNKTIQVINLGRSGLDFRRMYIHYTELAKKFSPDVVIVFVNESDFRSKDNNIGPELLVTDGDSLIIDYSFNKTNLFVNKSNLSYLRRFGFYSLLQASYSNFKSGRTGEIIFDKLYFDKKYSEDVTVNKLQSDPFYKLNNAILRSYYYDRISEGVTTLIVPIRELSEDITKQITMNNIEIINLEEVYYNLHDQNINPFFWPAVRINGHWNQIAHFEIGKYLSSKIVNYIK